MLHVRCSAWNPGLVEDAFLRCVSEQGQVSSGEESSYCFLLGGWTGLCKKPAIAIAGRVHQKSRDSHGSKMDTVQLGMQQDLGLLAGPIHQSSRYLKHQHIGWLHGCCIYWKPAFHHLKHVLFIHFQYFNKRPSSWSAIWTMWQVSLGTCGCVLQSKSESWFPWRTENRRRFQNASMALKSP